MRVPRAVRVIAVELWERHVSPETGKVVRMVRRKDLEVEETREPQECWT